MIKSRENIVAAWAFLIGLIIALLVGIITAWIPGITISPLILAVLAVIGIVVGYFVAEKDVQTFLFASVSLVIVSYMGMSGLVLGAAVSGVNIGSMISFIMQALLAMFVPATIIVAIKTVFSIAQS